MLCKKLLSYFILCLLTCVQLSYSSSTFLNNEKFREDSLLFFESYRKNQYIIVDQRMFIQEIISLIMIEKQPF